MFVHFTCTHTEHVSVSPSSFLHQMKNADYFSQFVTEDFEGYISRKRSDHCFGNNLEMQAMAEMYNRVIELYQYGAGGCVQRGMR